MPELPDVAVYVEALQKRILGQPVTALRLASPFVLRTVDPPPSDVAGKRVIDITRMGKRIVIALEDDRFIVIHLMIAGRFKWQQKGAKVPGKVGLAAFDFPNGTLILTEAGSKKRASLHLMRDRAAVDALDPGGIEVLETDLPTFRAALTRARHTLKRTLTDPHLFSGIGNAYSDEILHRARLSPIQMSTSLSDEEIERLFRATRGTLLDWTNRLRRESGDVFPEKVTAFREGMAVHGRYGKPCPDCGSPVQRIVYAENETNYCARCQTGGRLLADRALSRLLKGDWPKSIDEL
ncbi:MAG TPA: DNA-formamidopyrimidine glycosylase family protein [Thermoanaerobaculia bacterium]